MGRWLVGDGGTATVPSCGRPIGPIVFRVGNRKKNIGWATGRNRQYPCFGAYMNSPAGPGRCLSCASAGPEAHLRVVYFHLFVKKSVPDPMAGTVPPALEEPRQLEPLTQNRAPPSCDTASLRTQQPPPYGPPPLPPPAPQNAMTPGSSTLCWSPPPPLPMRWHRQAHRTQCRHTDEEEDNPR